jgi:hypothetical protein
MRLDVYCFHEDAFHASSFHGQDHGVLKQDTVTQINIRPWLICQDATALCASGSPWLYHPDKSAIVKQSTDLGHSIQFQDTRILAMKTRHMERIIREATQL